MFQSTRPGGARPFTQACPARHFVFQSTRPGGARLLAISLKAGTIRVSIHAPRRGATSLLFHVKIPHISFNPRAPAGRDIPYCSTSRYHISFQSTRPGGARRPRCPNSWRHSSCFNPRAPAGRDRGGGMADIVHYLFQSTRPGGARHAAAALDLAKQSVSIHAPRRGATSAKT